MSMGESAIASMPLLACGVAVVHDLRSREIPDWLPIAIVALLPVQWMFSEATIPWWQHVAGGVVALILGLIVGRGDRFGGGDIKLFAAIGAWFGIFAVAPLSLWIAIAGLPLAVVAAARTQRDFAYAPAILAGVCVHVFFPNLLRQIVS